MNRKEFKINSQKNTDFNYKVINSLVKEKGTYYLFNLSKLRGYSQINEPYTTTTI